MSGLPVTIRLIDPPLHEFLPTELAVTMELTHARQQRMSREIIGPLEELLARVQQLSESNPMLGLRGCRLGIVHPEILVMQITAIIQAAIKVEAEGLVPRPEIMIPLVASVEEVRIVRKLIDSTASAIFRKEGLSIAYRVGAMIELPRAAVCAGSIAKELDFLSFGTNDLTQMTFGFSRDDSQKYLDAYRELGILKQDPFVTLDREGVGLLIRLAVHQARAANRGISIGVCGEHGGDPLSIEFFQEIGVDYVSCSPARIAVAQLSAARAGLAVEPRSREAVATPGPEGHAVARV
jgi:pyruvate,orthophosphate dikinase